MNKNELIVNMDTGADCDVISVRDLEELKIDTKDKTEILFRPQDITPGSATN